MADIRLRPRFRRDVACAPVELLRALDADLAAPDAPARGTVFDSSAVLKVLPGMRHTWSPQLELSVEPVAGGCIVHGLFGPHPTIWSLFVGLYVAIGFAGAMGVAYGGAQWLLGQTPWAFWSGPASIVLAFLVWVVGRTGRRLGFEQVRMLYDFVDASVRTCEAGRTMDHVRTPDADPGEQAPDPARPRG